MTKRSKKIPQQPSSPVGKSSRRRPRASSSWYKAVVDPFNAPPTSIPDDQTSPSAKYQHRMVFDVFTSDVAVPAAANGGGALICIAPMIGFSNAAGSGVVSINKWNSQLGAFVPSAPVLASSYPNFTSAFPSKSLGSGALTKFPYEVRVTALEARLTPTLPELARGGLIMPFLSEPPQRNPITIANAITPYNILCGANDANLTAQQLIERSRRYDIQRTPDGAVVVRWIPSGVPKYTKLLDAPTGNEQYIDWISSNPGPIVGFHVDMTALSSPAFAPQTFVLEVVAHSETVASFPEAMVVKPTVSPFSYTDLEYCLNQFQRLSSSLTYTKDGMTARDDHISSGSNTSSMLSSGLSQALDWGTSAQGLRAIQNSLRVLNLLGSNGVLHPVGHRQRLRLQN